MSLQFGSRQLRRRARMLSVAAAIALSSRAAYGQTYYWDVNGANPGASDGATASGAWYDSIANWTTDPAGLSPTTTFGGGSVVFSAGNNATGASTVTVSAFFPTISGFTVEEGEITLAGSSTIQNGSNPGLIKPGASLFAGNRFSTNSTGTLTIDGGTFSGAWRGPALLTANGGTVYAKPDSLPIGTTSIVGAIGLAPGVTSASLTKVGAGIYAAHGPGAFDTLNVNAGTYNVSLSDLGFGVPTGTVNIADGASVGLGSNSSPDVISPTTRQFVVSGQASFLINSSRAWTINSPVSGPGSLNFGGSISSRFVLAGANTYAGSTTINNGTVTITGGSAIPDASTVQFGQGNPTLLVSADETVGAIASTSSGAWIWFNSPLPSIYPTLAVGANNSSTTYRGRIDGDGYLKKIGAGTFTLASTASVSLHGGLVVEGGTLVLDGAWLTSTTEIGDGTSTSATLTVRTGSSLFGSRVRVNGSGATLKLESNTGVGTTSLSRMKLENGGKVTGSPGLSVLGFEMDLRDGSIDVPVIGNGSSVIKSTSGTVTLNGLNTYTGGTNVSGGTLRVKRLQENNAVSITGGSTLQVMESLPTLPDNPTGNDTFVSRPSSLVIEHDAAPLGTRVYSGTLDLANNDLILDYVDVNPTANVEDMVRAGYHGGDWLGTGITSSTAASPLADGRYVLAVADNSTLAVPFGDGVTGPLFDGQSVDLTTVLVRFTERVDLNLDGVITPTDHALFYGAYSEGTPATWATGDLNFDGLHTSSDVAIFEQFYAVPEPSLLAFGLAALAVRRRPQRI